MSIFGLGFMAVFIYILVKNLSGQAGIGLSPRTAVQAGVIDKKENISRTQHPLNNDLTGASGFTTSTRTSYEVTFQLSGGERKTFTVERAVYELLLEGDYGTLTYQGPKYIGFERSGSIH